MQEENKKENPQIAFYLVSKIGRVRLPEAVFVTGFIFFRAAGDM